MSKLLWDQLGQRFYETGLDRGVLYLSDGSGVAWSGLTGLDEDFGDDTSTAQYFDGIKSNDVPSIGDFSATLNAITYPDEFLDFEGYTDLGDGLFVDGQTAKVFGLSYRTIIGNDLDNVGFGYKIHILYNLTASLSTNTSYETVDDSPKPIEFSWSITGVPVEVLNYRPTVHVILNSTLLPPAILASIEGILYGDANADARLPSIEELVDIVINWGPRIIVPDTIAGLAQLTAGVGDLTEINVPGIYTALPSNRLVAAETDGFYRLP